MQDAEANIAPELFICVCGDKEKDDMNIHGLRSAEGMCGWLDERNLFYKVLKKHCKNTVQFL